jgi:hypothetical protein
MGFSLQCGWLDVLCNGYKAELDNSLAEGVTMAKSKQSRSL